MSNIDEKVIRCLECAAEFTDKETYNITKCPECKTTATPCWIKDDVIIKCTINEMWCLLDLAYQYAEKNWIKGKFTLCCIEQRMSAQTAFESHLFCDDIDIEIEINWHELRVITIWATNFITVMDVSDDVLIKVNGIIKKLLQFRPQDCAGLTLVQEIKELQEVFPNSELRVGDEIIVPSLEVEE